MVRMGLILPFARLPMNVHPSVRSDLPHAMAVRVLLIEQPHCAWSINANHPTTVSIDGPHACQAIACAAAEERVLPWGGPGGQTSVPMLYFSLPKPAAQPVA